MKRLIFVLMICQGILFAQSGELNLDDFEAPPQPAAEQPQNNPPATSSQPAATEEPPADVRESAENDTIGARDTALAAAAEEDRKRLWEIWETDHRPSYEMRIRLIIWVMFLWLLLAVGLILYGLYRFHFTAGLGRERYNRLVKLIDESDDIPIGEKSLHYPQNPHEDQTFGLPRGTVRGLLTLTLLFANCSLLYVMAFSPPAIAIEGRTEYIKTAFLMMIAFYFGSKAVDTLKAREKTRRKLGVREDAYYDGETGAAGASPDAKKKAAAKKAPPVELRPTTHPERDFDHTAKMIDNVTSDSGLKKRPVREKCLALTTYFETGKRIEDAYGITAGNFDGMGISFGCLQWNLGQGTLQPILNNYFEFGDDEWRNDPLMKQLHQILQSPKSSQLDWANTIQEKRGNKHVIFPEWVETFKKLGEKTSSWQLNATKKRFDIAEGWCRDWGLTSERALSLMFDINVQNGNLYKKIRSRNIDVRKSIEQRIINAGSPSEEQKMIIIAEERAKVSLPRWQKVVLDRKLTIAKGKGKVYGTMLNLDDFDLSIDRDFA